MQKIENEQKRAKDLEKKFLGYDFQRALREYSSSLSYFSGSSETAETRMNRERLENAFSGLREIVSFRDSKIQHLERRIKSLEEESQNMDEFVESVMSINEKIEHDLKILRRTCTTRNFISFFLGIGWASCLCLKLVSFL